MAAMNTRQRILSLYESGTEPHVVAALLNLDINDVALTLADPTHTPSDPAGGGGSTFWARLEIISQSEDPLGVVTFPIHSDGVTPFSVVSMPIILPAGEKGFWFNILPPKFSAGVCQVAIPAIVVSDGLGTQQFSLRAPVAIDLASEVEVEVDLATLVALNDPTGADLSVQANRINSAAGGCFSAGIEGNFFGEGMVA